MLCAYSQDGDSACQFEHQERWPMIVDGKRWCSFHAPLENKDGSPTNKKIWGDEKYSGTEYKEWFYGKISELRETALKEQKTLNLSGVVFPGKANFANVEFPEVDFSHARFEGNADFQNARFSYGNAHFPSVKFCGEANFSGAMFSDVDVDFKDTEFNGKTRFSHIKCNGGNAIFKNATFKAGAHFEGAEFSHGDVNFENARFCGDNKDDFSSFTSAKFSGGDTSFRDAQFGKSVSFQKVRFDDGEVEFENAEFQEDANFQGVEFCNGRKGFNKTTFIDKADFQNAQFLNGCAFFEQAKFYGDTDFSSAVFNEGVDFREAEFKGKTNFDTTKFKTWDTFFSNAKFLGGDADFKNAYFEWNAYFENTQFRWNAIFSEAEFKKSAHFEEAFFGRDTYFRNTVFSSGIGEVNFKKSKFKGKTDFKSSGKNGDLNSFQGEIDFSGAKFLGDPIDEVTFENRTFQKRTSFRGCTFEKAPRFHGCSLHQDTDFTDARFLDRQGDEATRAYRTLKLDMEEKRAREEHLMFYALEMESRQRTTKKKLLKFLSSLYGMTADYGQSVSRPLLWLGCSYLIFATIYTIFFNELLKEHLVHTDNLHLFFHFSLEQIVRPFRALEFSPLVEFLKKIPAANHFLLRFIAAFQSLLSLVLLLLFGLAVRWRFKIG